MIITLCIAKKENDVLVALDVPVMIVESVNSALINPSSLELEKRSNVV